MPAKQPTLFAMDSTPIADVIFGQPLTAKKKRFSANNIASSSLGTFKYHVTLREGFAQTVMGGGGLAKSSYNFYSG